MRIQELFDTLVARGTTPHNLKSSVARLPKAQREEATKKFDLLKARFWKKEEKERLAVARAARSKKAARYRSVGLSLKKDETKAKAILNSFVGATGRSMGEKLYLFVAGHYIDAEDTREEYSRSSKYKAQHSILKIRMSKREFRESVILQDTVVVPGEYTFALIPEGKYDNTKVRAVYGKIVTKVYDTPIGLVEHNSFVAD